MSAQEYEWTAIVVFQVEYGRWPIVITHCLKYYSTICLSHFSALADNVNAGFMEGWSPWLREQTLVVVCYRLLVISLNLAYETPHTTS